MLRWLNFITGKVRPDPLSPNELYELTDKLIAALRAKNIDASPLENVQSTAYTTGNEWRGELYAALKKVKSSSKSLDTDSKEELKRLMALVRG